MEKSLLPGNQGGLGTTSDPSKRKQENLLKSSEIHNRPNNGARLS